MGLAAGAAVAGLTVILTVVGSRNPMDLQNWPEKLPVRESKTSHEPTC